MASSTASAMVSPRRFMVPFLWLSVVLLAGQLDGVGAQVRPAEIAYGGDESMGEEAAEAEVAAAAGILSCDPVLLLGLLVGGTREVVAGDDEGREAFQRVGEVVAVAAGCGEDREIDRGLRGPRVVQRRQAVGASCGARGPLIGLVVDRHGAVA